MLNDQDTTFYNLPFKLDYEYIKTPEEAFKSFEYFDRFNVMGVDTETNGLDPYNNTVILLQLALPNGKVFVYDLRYIPGELFRVLLEDDRFLHILQNAVFDYKMMKANYGITINRLYDTMIAERCINLGLLNMPANLGHLVYKYLNYRIDKDVATEFCDGTRTELTNRQIQYAAHDAACLFGIVKAQSQVISSNKLNNVCKLEFEFAPCMADMELAGVLLDQDKWRVIIKETEEELNTLIKNVLPAIAPGVNQTGLFGAPAINLGSNVKLLTCLNNLGLHLENTSVGSLQICKHKHEAVPMLLKYRQLEKLLSSFGENILAKIHTKTGRLHSTYNQIVSTGRLSCRAPNLQQIPKKSSFRSCFVAKPGYKMVTNDMSQAELRILACYSKDPVFIDAYLQGKDLHVATACGVYGLTEEEVIADDFLLDDDPNKKDYRGNTKSINFGLCYGMSKYGLAAKLGITEDAAEEMIDTYFQTYPGVKRYLDRAANDAVNKGYSTTISGRKRYYTLPGASVDKDERRKQLNSIKRRGKNTGIQGCFVYNTNIFGAGMIGENVNKTRILSAGKEGSITAIGQYSGKQKVYKLTTAMGFTLKGTFDHPIMIRGKKYNKDIMMPLGETKGMQARMVSGKYKGFPINISDTIKKFKVITKNNYITPELGFMLGCLYDSGYFESRQKLFYINNKIITDKLVESCSKYFRSLGNLSKYSPIRFMNRGSKVFINFNESVKKLLYYLLYDNVGRIGHISYILNSPVEVREAFVSGFLGCRSRINEKKQKIAILCSNNTVAFTVQQLLLSLGIISFKEDGVDGDCQLGVLDDFITNAGKLVDDYGLGLDLFIPMPDLEFYDEIKSIKECSIEDTYDFVSGDEPHMYVANGFKVSNSNADVLKKAIINISNNIKKEGYDAETILNIHDEVVVEVREDQAEAVANTVSKSMVDAWDYFFTDVPMVADSNIDYCWNK